MGLNVYYPKYNTIKRAWVFFYVNCCIRRNTSTRNIFGTLNYEPFYAEISIKEKEALKKETEYLIRNKTED